MKRIVLLIDGTWDHEGVAGNTNVAKLDPRAKCVSARLIPHTTSDGIRQIVHYHKGVGVSRDPAEKVLGGMIGFGLKKIIQQVYECLVQCYEPGDEIYIVGFSRGSYAARALAGLIGASGIQRRKDDRVFELAWRHYRVKPAIRHAPNTAGLGDRKTIAAYNALAAERGFHDDRSIACVGVWDTVGSYGIPAGLGFYALARYIALVRLGFHDTSFGDHIAVGLHAVAVDEHRRPFVPTFWTIAKGLQPNGHVEQTWFCGAHCNVGGSYPDSGLSDLALIWMIARIQALTKLEFDTAAVVANTQPNVGGVVVDSTKGWLIDHLLPYYRPVLSPSAICHGYFSSWAESHHQPINERVHWSVITRRDQNLDRGAAHSPPYAPPNLRPDVPPAKIAAMTDEERLLVDRRTKEVC